MADRSVKLYGGDVEINFNDKKHVYTTNISPHPIPGVTTILRRINKPALMPWAAKQTSEHSAKHIPAELIPALSELLTGADGQDPWTLSNVSDLVKTVVERVCKESKGAYRKFSGAAADIGTQVHTYAEKYMSGDIMPPEPTDPAVIAGANAFVAWFAQHKIEPIALERIIFSKNYYYAGTCDFYGQIDGELCVLDFKTSTGIYEEHVLQLAGYALALNEELDIKIDVGYIIRLDKKTGQPHTHRIPLLKLYESAFVDILEFDKKMKRITKEQMDGIRKTE